MSTSVSTMRAGANKLPGPNDKSAKGDMSTSSQPTNAKTDGHSKKMQPTQEQLRLAQMMSINQMDADPNTVKQLMDMTGKSEDVVVIALHDAGNDADRAVMTLLEGGEEQDEWRECGKKKKKNTPKESSGNEDHSDSRNRDRGDNQDMPPRRGRRNGVPPPRLARGRGRERGNFGDRDRERNNASAEDWDNDKEDRGPRGDRGDRGRFRGRGGFSGRRPAGAMSSGRGGRFNNDRENRGFTRPRRFEKMNNSQPLDGPEPEIDTWTNETAETKTTNKDTDWNSWNDSWVNEEDQWTGTLEETKVFTPSHVKMPEPDPVTNEPPSTLGQRLDVGSLFESAKFTKAPDYSKPSGDSYINQFNQAATESIKNTIGIGNASRPQIPMSPPDTSDSLGLANLGQKTAQVQGSSVMPSLQQSAQQNALPHAMAQLSQISQPASQSTSMSQMGMGSPPSQAGANQAPQQSRIPAVVQQQQNLPQSNMNNMPQRPKTQRSKLPPPSKIPSTAVEMPGHIPRNPQLDVQFGLDFGSESSVQFGFGGSGDNTTVTSSYSTTSNGSAAVISNHLNQGHMTQSAGDGNSVSPIMPSPSAGSTNVPSGIETQGPPNRQGVFHNSMYSSPQQQKTESQSLELDQNKVNDSIPFLSTQLERKSSPMASQRQGQTNQNLTSGPMTSSKSDSTSAVANNSYSVANGYSSSYQSHPKGSSISHTATSQPSQTSSFHGQYPVNQSSFPSSGQSPFPTPPNANAFPSAQPSQFSTSSSSQNQFSTGQNQYSVGTSTLTHQNNQFPSSGQNNYGSGSSQYSGYQNNSSFPTHPQSQTNFPSSQNGGTGAVLYPTSTQSGVSSYTTQSGSYQSPSAGSYHSSRDSSTTNMAVSTQSSTSGMTFPSQPQASNLKPATTQSNTSFNSQSYPNPPQLQPSSLANKLGESLSKISMKDSSSVLDNHQSSQYEHTPSPASVPTSVSLPSASSSASLSTGTNAISSTSTVTSASPASRVASMPSTSGKAPPNLPPGVPLMGQYIMGQSTIPPFYSVQPPLYGYEDVQLLQQRMPMQTGSFYDVNAFPAAPAGSTLPTGRDPQPPIPNVPFSGTSDTKLARVDAQSPNASSQPQSAHSAAQQPLFNFHYGYYYPSMFPGAAGLQYPATVYPVSQIPPVTNAAAHQGTTATTQFQKSYPSHVYTTKGYDEVNQVQDYSKTGYGSSQTSGKASGTRSGTSEITPNAYTKSHGQAGFDKQGYHGGTPPPFNLPLASATQTGPMGAPTTPYGAPFLPVMAAHQPHSQMMHHPIQQDNTTTNSRGLNPAGGQAKSGAAKSFGGPPYWNN